MSAAPTPGPWFAQPGADDEAGMWMVASSTEPYTVSGGGIAWVGTDLDASPEELAQCAVNARLIAAAPVMLAALQSVVSDSGGCWVAVHAAITAALGDAP